MAAGHPLHLCDRRNLWIDLLRGAEEGGETEEVCEDAARRYFRAGAGASHDHWLRVVTCGLEAHDVVAAGQARERVIDGVVAQLSRHLAVTIDRADVTYYLASLASRV